MTLKEAQHGGFPNSESKTIGKRSKKGNKGRTPTPEERQKDYEVVAGDVVKSKKKLDKTAPEAVSSPQSPATSSATSLTTSPATPLAKEQNMVLAFKGLGKSGKMAFYTGAALTLSIPVNAFVDKKAPATIEDLSVFAEPRVKAAKIVETKEERKVRLAALPKKTLAEKVAAAEARTEALKAKLAKQAPAGM